MPKPAKIAIAGAGIAGLACAIGLARQGMQVDVFERTAKIEEFGAGLQIGPNAARALEYLEVWPALLPQTFAPASIIIRDGQTARTLTALGLREVFERRFGKPYLVALRADLHAALLKSARQLDAIAIHTNAGVNSFDERASLTLNFTDRPPCKADAIIAADGIRSTIRQQLWPGTAPRKAGHTIYRALIPAGTGSQGKDNDCVTLWLCPSGHVVQYPLPGGRLNIVAVHETRQDLSGWNSQAGAGEVTGLFQKSAPPLMNLLNTVRTWSKWPGADLNPASSWGKGNITLIGDAAHAALPYLAQGAAMALEDAAVLARQMAHDPAEPAQAMRRYEALRQERTRRIVLQSRKMGQTYHFSGLKAQIRNAALLAMPQSVLREKLSWIYDWRD